MPLGWWGEGSEKVLGGRDLLGGGTWMGCTKDGSLAFLTNVLEPDSNPTAKTRGDLPLMFLQSKKSPMEFAEEIVKEADKYNGFNLITADLCSKTMVYISNRPKGEPLTIQMVSPGLHVLSNAKLDTPWHKSQRLATNLRELLQEHGEEELNPSEMVDMLMVDTVQADQDRLPKTGCDADWELKLSSIFIEVDTELGWYGTRSTAVLLVKDEEVNFYEKYLESGIWKDHNVQYHIESSTSKNVTIV